MLYQPSLEASYDQCLKCHACTVNCPISSVSTEFGGPKQLGPELQRMTQNQGILDDASIELCTLCGTCDRTCPENIHVSSLTAYLKETHAEEVGTKFRDIVLSKAEWVGKLASTFAPVTNATMKLKPARKVMEWIMEIPAERNFPEYRFNNFKRKYKIKESTTERKVAYFAGCYATYNAPDVADSFVKVMEYNGIEVAVPKQNCCGVPMFANGQMKAGKKNAQSNIDSFLSYVDQGYDVVMTCSSCTLAMKKEYPGYMQTEEAQRLAENVYDADEYLRILYEKGELNDSLSALNDKAAYYAPCHMKGQGIGNPAMDMLELIPGYQIEDMAAGCCGQCGTFGFKKEKYSYSMALGDTMVDSKSMAESDYVVTECGMCKNQFDQLTDKEVRHPIQVLRQSYELN
ncbi:anaerobic glycerol-3-phosphate dehydrogenase subunit C [Salipaludibacillus daqingensis]|uniref:anaerobic glycerol-3-phosphate dehydrogenase subunit C n=1 Tax=Salipaludibacillus daqingensis TaxID=3041001 RepID=UPI002476C537|nr:anaerobic glycerol-3-phosphate dehydrogenase subunit C [Salipaludibacillus daqingensis]